MQIWLTALDCMSSEIDKIDSAILDILFKFRDESIMLFNKSISEDFCILFVRNKNTDRLIRQIESILKHKFDSIDFVESTCHASELVKILYNKYLLMYTTESMYNKLSTDKDLKLILNNTKVQDEDIIKEYVSRKFGGD